MFTLQDTADAPPQMLLVSPEHQHQTWVNLLEKASPKWPIHHILRSPRVMVTHQSSLPTVEIPVPKGIHDELTRHSYTTIRTLPQKNNTPHWVPIVAQGWFLRQ